MNDGYERALSAFSRLSAERPHAGNVLRINVGAGESYEESIIARDERGRFHLMVDLPASRDRFTVPMSDVMECRWLTLEGRERLDVICGDTQLQPTFTSLIGEMLDRAESSGLPAIDELQKVLDSWRRALSGVRAEASRETLSGLFGELLVAREIAGQEPEAVQRLWKGPSGSVHDFADRHAVEVKTYRTAGTPIVTIHGVDQLDPPNQGDLHLVTYRIWEHPSGRTVDELADEIEDLGVPSAFLRGAFEALGVQRRDAQQLHLLSSEPRVHRVADGFPGLRRTQLSPHQLRGVDRIQFGIVLDACPPPLPEGALNTVLRELRGADR